MENVVIAGGGLAGARAAEALRAAGYGGELTLVGAEPHPPYDRPPLSKAVLKGAADDTALGVDLDALRCRPLLGHRATALRLADGAGGAVETTAGELPFDGLVIATGASPVALPGAAAHLLRTIDDARALRATLRPGRRLAIVGAGWIGAEVATAAAAAGCRVTVVEAAGAPLSAALGAEVGALTVPWYAEAGVELVTGRQVAAVEPGGLALSGGTWIDADEVLVCVGVRPETGWLEGSGLALDRGVVVDGSLRAALAEAGAGSPGGARAGAPRPEIVAVGDCAAWWSARYRRRLRVEHWDTALNSPDVAAATLVGRPATYDPVPYFWSEQFGRMVQYAGAHGSGAAGTERGAADGAERLVMRGDPAGRKWAACWLSGDRLDAILTVDQPRDLVQARRIMTSGGLVDPGLLANPDIAVRNAVTS
jgi:3-phenylpropionate/trans-cinnamate dioxygenase ferredoxin reductase subunit